MGLLATALLALPQPARAATNTVLMARGYPGGMQVAARIGSDLYQTLDPRFQKAIAPQALSLEESEAPIIAPIHANGPGSRCQISVSTGFIDLINHIAHAKAIDRVEPGYFTRYISSLAREPVNQTPAPPANLDDARYWTADVMSDQASLFNQMIGFAIAMNLSHQYLAHYNKRATAMSDGNGTPINNLITPREWEATVKCATLNALDCALPTDGARTLFSMIDEMPAHPAWAGYIVPETVNIKNLNKELSQYEREYFTGDLKLGHRILALSLGSIGNGPN